MSVAMLRVAMVTTCFQYQDVTERISQLDYEGEELRNEIQMKVQQLADMQDNLADLKTELHTIREQKQRDEAEVGEGDIGGGGGANFCWQHMWSL